jgi:hypothetical protein
MKILTTLVALAVTLVLAAALFVFSGLYDMGADAPHWPATHRMISILRDRSIAARSTDLHAPDLSDSKLILKGTGQYAAMCVDCHLSPDKRTSEIRPDLYPQPPDLVRVRIEPRAAFWAIKHGIKMSAMPAWGAGHDDATIWSIVAFLQKLPDLNVAQYKQIIAEAPPDEDMDMSTESDHPMAH